MTTLQLTGRISDTRQLELDCPLNLPPGEVKVTLETGEIAEDAQWDASFAQSVALFARMAAQVRAEIAEGRTVDLNPDELETDAL